MKKRPVLFVLLLLLPGFALTQTLQWSQIYPDAQMVDITPGHSGEFITAGYDLVEGNHGLLWSLDVEGNTLWDQTYNYGQFLTDAVPDNDDGYVAVGSTGFPPDYHWKGWLQRTDGSGTVLWQREYYSQSDTSRCQLRTLCKDIDGNYVSGGIADNEIYTGKTWALKFDDDGDTLWNRAFDLGSYSAFTDLIAHPFNGAIGCGSVKLLPDDSTYAPFILRLNNDGDTLWTHTYSFPQTTYIHKIQAHPLGGYIGVGSRFVAPDSSQAFLMRFDDRGDTLGTLFYELSEPASFGAVAFLPPDRWVMGGYVYAVNNQKAMVMICDLDGHRLSYNSFGSSQYNWVSGIAVDEQGSILCAGTANFTLSGNADGWVFAVDTTVVAVEWGGGSQQPPLSYNLYPCFPNPFNAQTTITFDLSVTSEVTLDIFDISGRKVWTVAAGVHNAGNPKVHFNAYKLSSGVYFYRVTAKGLERGGSYQSVGKMLLLK